MENILLVPIAISIVLTLFIPLAELAQDASEKTLRYTEDMDRAIDCAFAGVNIGECAPSLMQTDFSDELNRTTELTNKFEHVSTEELQSLLEELQALKTTEVPN